MANVLHKVTLDYYESVNTPDYPESDWIINPVLPNCARKYWKIDGGQVTEMNPQEKEVVDTSETNRLKEVLLDAIYQVYEECERNNLSPAGAIQLAEWCGVGNVKALAVRQWIVDLYSERDTKIIMVEGGNLSVDPTPSTPTKPYSFREMKVG